MELFEDGTALLASGVQFSMWRGWHRSGTVGKGTIAKIYEFDFYEFAKTAEKETNDKVQRRTSPKVKEVDRERVRDTRTLAGTHPDSLFTTIASLSPKHRTLTHSSTFRNANFVSLSAIVAVGADKLFAINDHAYFNNPYMHLAEHVTLTHTGNLIMYDGKNATVIDTGLAVPSGLAVDRVKGFLYVSLTALESTQSKAGQTGVVAYGCSGAPQPGQSTAWASKWGANTPSGYQRAPSHEPILKPTPAPQAPVFVQQQQQVGCKQTMHANLCVQTQPRSSLRNSNTNEGWSQARAAPRAANDTTEDDASSYGQGPTLADRSPAAMAERRQQQQHRREAAV
ncbi:unnamed protein product [Sphagnum balticum]